MDTGYYIFVPIYPLLCYQIPGRALRLIQVVLPNGKCGLCNLQSDNLVTDHLQRWPQQPIFNTLLKWISCHVSQPYIFWVWNRLHLPSTAIGQLPLQGQKLSQKKRLHEIQIKSPIAFQWSRQVDVENIWKGLKEGGRRKGAFDLPSGKQSYCLRPITSKPGNLNHSRNYRHLQHLSRNIACQGGVTPDPDRTVTFLPRPLSLPNLLRWLILVRRPVQLPNQETTYHRHS